MVSAREVHAPLPRRGRHPGHRPRGRVRAPVADGRAARPAPRRAERRARAGPALLARPAGRARRRRRGRVAARRARPRRRTPRVVRRPDPPHVAAGLLPTGRPRRLPRLVPGDRGVAGVDAAARRLDPRAGARARRGASRARCRSSGSAPTWWSTATSRSPRTGGPRSPSAGCGSGWASPSAAA